MAHFPFYAYAAGGVTPGTPVLIQHVASAIDRFDCGTFNIALPNPSLSGNCLIMGLQFRATSETVSSVTDDKGNTWTLATSVNDGTSGQTVAVYYALNCIAGTTNIVVTFTAGGSGNVYPQASVSEFNQIATSSAIDGTPSAAVSRTAGSITTTANSDLVYQYGCAVSTTTTTGGGFNGTSITKGTGFTLLNADLQVGTVAQYQVQSTAGAINPAFTTSGSDTWASVGVAFKSDNSKGTAPPGTMYIVHLQHILLSSVNVQGRSTRIVMQFPSTGNLIVGGWDCGTGVPTLTSVTDGNSNTYKIPPGAYQKSGSTNSATQIFYAKSATTSTDLASLTITGSAAGTGDEMLLLYDIANAPSRTVDQFARFSGTQSSNAALTTGSVTPNNSSGLIIHAGSWDTHTANALTAPSGGILDATWNDFDDDGAGSGGTNPSTLEMDNPKAHYYNSSNSSVSFTFNYNHSKSSVLGVGGWSGTTLSFAGSNPAGIALGTPTAFDNFSGQDDSPITGNWTTTTNALKLASHTITFVSSGSDREAIWNIWSDGDDQFSELEVTESGGATGVGLGVCVRHSSTIGTKTMYRLVLNGSGGYELGRIVSGTFTSLRTGTVTYAAGTKLGLSVSGQNTATTLKVWYGRTQVGTNFVDSGGSAINTGLPGVAYSSTATSCSGANWIAGTVP